MFTVERQQANAIARKQKLDEEALKKERQDRIDAENSHKQHIQQLDQKAAANKKMKEEEYQRGLEEQKKYLEMGFNKRAEDMESKLGELRERTEATEPTKYGVIARGLANVATGIGEVVTGAGSYLNPFSYFKK